MFKKIYRFFDKFEDGNRSRLSHSPILYAVVTGAGIILFWRGIWHAADETPILQNSFVSIIIGAVLLLAIGTFISSFIGNEIIISGNKKEEKLVYKIVEAEEQDTAHELEDDVKLMREIKDIKSQLNEIKSMLEEK